MKVTEAPELPAGRVWHERTQDWWRTLWAAPWASQYVPADIDGLRVLAALLDAFWAEGKVSVLGEVRLWSGLFGLDPVSRRRLGWEVAPVPETEPQRPEAPKAPRFDPRKVLEMRKPKGDPA